MTDNPDFTPTSRHALAPGVVLRLAGQTGQYLRLTHIFHSCVYGMTVSTPENARYAKRPAKYSLEELNKLSNQPGASWGKLPLPQELSGGYAPGSAKEITVERNWAIISPLVTAFESERNLSRQAFTQQLLRHAEVAQIALRSLHRLLYRYYYFGCTKAALLPLSSGPGPIENPLSTQSRKLRQNKRVGRGVCQGS